MQIPYDGNSMFANLRQPARADHPPVVIIIPGMDSTKEEFHYSEQLFLDRGMAVLSVDGPGRQLGELLGHQTREDRRQNALQPDAF